MINNRITLRRLILLSALMLVCTCIFSACGRNRQSSVSKTTFLLNTQVTVTLYGTDDESIIEDCFSLCKSYEDLFSRTEEGSGAVSDQSQGNGRTVGRHVIADPYRSFLQ